MIPRCRIRGTQVVSLAILHETNLTFLWVKYQFSIACQEMNEDRGISPFYLARA